jgi:hypothetical protein
MSACERFREGLLDVASGAEDAGVRAHVAECADCRRELEELRGILAAPAEEIEAPPETNAPALVREDLAAIAALGGRAPLVAAAALAMMAIGIPAIMLVHRRPDLAELPKGFLWSALVTMALLGAAGVVFATRLSALSRTLAGTFVAVAAIAFAGLALAMPSGPSSVVPAPGADAARHMVPCFVVATGQALLTVAVVAWLLRHARFFPGPAAICVGVGAGLLAMPVVEVFCPVSVATHLFAAHGGAIAFAALLSRAGFRMMERRRLG